MSGIDRVARPVDAHEESQAFAAEARQVLASSKSPILKAVSLIQLSLLGAYSQNPTGTAQAIGNQIRTWSWRLREEA